MTIYMGGVSRVSNAIIEDGRNQTNRFHTVLRTVTCIGVPVDTAGMVTSETRLKDISLVR